MGLLSWLSGKEKGEDAEFTVENEQLDGMALNEIIAKHMHWNKRLADYLEGVSLEELSAEEISKDYLCELGKWIHGSGKEIYGKSEEWMNLKNTHAKFHQSAGSILYSYKSGDIKKAKHLLETDFKNLSAAIRLDLALLYQLQRKKNHEK